MTESHTSRPSSASTGLLRLQGQALIRFIVSILGVTIAIVLLVVRYDYGSVLVFVLIGTPYFLLRVRKPLRPPRELADAWVLVVALIIFALLGLVWLMGVLVSHNVTLNLPLLSIPEPSPWLKAVFAVPLWVCWYFSLLKQAHTYQDASSPR